MHLVPQLDQYEKFKGHMAWVNALESTEIQSITDNLPNTPSDFNNAREPLLKQCFDWLKEKEHLLLILQAQLGMAFTFKDALLFIRMRKEFDSSLEQKRCVSLIENHNHFSKIFNEILPIIRHADPHFLKVITECSGFFIKDQAVYCPELTNAYKSLEERLEKISKRWEIYSQADLIQTTQKLPNSAPIRILIKEGSCQRQGVNME